jgi:hypothetical protein
VRKGRPDTTINQGLLTRAQGLFARIYSERNREILIENTIDKHGQTRDMIQVCMCQKYVSNRVQVGQFKVTDPGSRVDQNIVVDEHGRGT